jgi:pimeloyl-ACP methyl ester carboxylesterase
MESSKIIVFVHGLFVNPESWRDWKLFFEARGYQCHTPANPFHDGTPGELWKHVRPGLGKVTFEDVVNNIARFIDTLPAKPILVGHSLGGLAVQKLIEMQKGEAGICIDGAAPLGIVTTKLSFWRSNFPVINFLRGNSVFYPTKEWFHYAFCNTMTREESDKNFDLFVVPESRNIPRGTLKPFAHINFRKPHAPLLFIAGEKDHIIPASLNESNFKAYKAPGSRRDFKIFKGRGHFICGEAGWQEVAEFALNWIARL